MSFKQYFPIVVVVATAAAILAAFLLTGENPDPKIHAAALEHVRKTRIAAGEVEGRDFQLGAVEIVGAINPAGTLVGVEVRPQSYYVFLNVVRDGSWKVKEDLLANFSDFWGQPDSRKPLLDRLGKRLVDRWQKPVNLRDEPQAYTFMLEKEDKDVVSKVEFRYAMDWPDGARTSGRYLEKFRYKDGTWVSDGLGTMFDRVP